MKAQGDVDARVHIYAATALEEVEWLDLCSAIFTPGKALVLILQEAEWIPGPVWT